MRVNRCGRFVASFLKPLEIRYAAQVESRRFHIFHRLRAIGVVLGAALTFCIQLYGNRVEDQRIARKTRAEHIERMMIATSKMKNVSATFVFRLAEISNKVRTLGPGAPNWENMMPEMGPANELRAVSALYLPEVEADADRVSDAFFGICREAVNSIELKSGTEAPPVQVNEKSLRALQEAASVLQNKLIELARKNRQ